MSGSRRRFVITACVIGVLPGGRPSPVRQETPGIPLVPGLTIVLAAHNTVPAGTPVTVKNVAQGDYEMVVTVNGVSAAGIDETTSIMGVDEEKKDLRVTVRRRVLAADVAGARLQILAFHTDDPQEIRGATSLGPSLAVVRDLRTTGRAAYSVVGFLGQPTSTGTLTRVGTTSVPFSLLLNGRRATLPAIRVSGLLRYNGKVRLWQQDILDDPKHPLTLRFAHSAAGDTVTFKAEFTREVVRIDFPAPANRAMEDALRTECRVEVPGVYFDFNRATLDPQSSRGLTTIAELMRRQPEWRLSVEGHTDNSGGDSYNQDLSTRRAAAVKAALVREFGIAEARLKSAGFGERRPLETNETIAGRAHNRRVELVRECAAKLP